MVHAASPPTAPFKESRRRTRSKPADEGRAEAAETEAAGERSIRLARFYQGKVEVVPKVPLRGLDDFSIWYTPGIAAVSQAIAKEPDLSFELTGRWNTIAIVTDGSRVLGLGNIGPRAALPVMEGKSLLFKHLGGVNAYPLPIEVSKQEELVETVVRLAPAVGGVNLEDIGSPKCFFVLEELQKRLEIPIWHDDQQGTAASTVAGLINALALTGRSFREVRTVLLGAGAANVATARLLESLGQDPRRLSIVDHRGILHGDREDLDELMLHNPWKYRLALKTHGGGREGGLTEALEGADVLVAASKPDPNSVTREMVRSMAPRPIVFALANPTPEIWPNVAKDAGAAIVATGRSDFPNQVNNSLIFPPLFRGVLDARARRIPDEIVSAAARELARQTEVVGLTTDHILPTMDEAGVFPHVAAAVAESTVRLGLARHRLSREEYFDLAQERMRRPELLVRALAAAGLTPPMPDEPRRRGRKAA